MLSHFWNSILRKCVAASPHPRVHTSTSLQVPESPRPHVPTSPTSLRPHVPESPRPRVPTSPRPHVPTSPSPHVPTSPRPHVPESPRPHVPTSPRSHVPTSPRPRVPTSQVPRPRPTFSHSQYILVSFSSGNDPFRSWRLTSFSVGLPRKAYAILCMCFERPKKKSIKPTQCRSSVIQTTHHRALHDLGLRGLL